MFYPAFLLTLVAHFVAVQCVPLRVLGPTNGSPAQASVIRQAAADAHNQILHVEHTLNSGAAHPHLVNAFGPNYNLEAIHNNIQTLKHGRIVVENAQHSNAHGQEFPGQGVTNPNNGHVSFGHAFYNSNPRLKAGTVIHEATHALVGTVDHWAPTHPQNPTGPYHPVGNNNHGALNGYVDSPHNAMLKHTNSHNMHLNADSYRMLAHTCTYGLNTPLLRRALSDPVKGEHIIRRAVESCMRSKVAANKSQHLKVDGAKKSPLVHKQKANKGAVPNAQGKVSVRHPKSVAPKAASTKRRISKAVSPVKKTK